MMLVPVSPPFRLLLLLACMGLMSNVCYVCLFSHSGVKRVLLLLVSH